MTFLALVQLVGRARPATLISTTALQTHAKTVLRVPMASTLTLAIASQDMLVSIVRRTLTTALQTHAAKIPQHAQI